MKENIKLKYDKIISERILQILEYAGLEIKGISELTDRSSDIFYAVISCRRSLSKELAEEIGKSLDFDGYIIFNINIPIPRTIKNSNKLKKFRSDNKNNKEYFIETWSERKYSNVLKNELIEKKYFMTPKYTWEVNDKLKSLGKAINSDLLSKQLKYFVKKGVLKSKKENIKMKNGKYGKRQVDVYFN